MPYFSEDTVLMKIDTTVNLFSQSEKKKTKTKRP